MLDFMTYWLSSVFTGLSATAMRRQAPRMRPPLRANVRWKHTHPTDWPIDRSHSSPLRLVFRFLTTLDHCYQPILINNRSANLNLSLYRCCTWTIILEYYVVIALWFLPRRGKLKEFLERWRMCNPFQVALLQIFFFFTF